MVKKTVNKSKSAMTMIVSNEKKPKIDLKPGMKLDVVSVSLIDPQLKKLRPGAARLCGGTTTCLALVDLGKNDPKV